MEFFCRLPCKSSFVLVFIRMELTMSKKKQKKKDKYNKEMGLASALDCFHNIQRNERAMWYWLFYVITYDDLKGNV